MRNSIATYKESLLRIASDVLDDDEEFEIVGSRSERGSPFRERRFSRRFSPSPSPAEAPVSNGVDFGSGSEEPRLLWGINQQRAEIERLQASEAEIKALAINYAAILKEKEGQLSRLHDENSSLRKSLEVKNATMHASRDENVRATKSNSNSNKGALNHSPSKHHRHTIQASPHGAHKETISKQDAFSNGNAQSSFLGFQPTLDREPANFPGTEKEHESIIEENYTALSAIRATHESEINQLKLQLKDEREVSANLKLKFQDAYDVSETSKKELLHMKLENERSSAEMKELEKKLDMKISEVTQLQAELDRRNTDKKLDESLQTLKTAVATLEKENAKLKIENDRLKAVLEHGLGNPPTQADADISNFSNEKAKSRTGDQEKEELLLSVQKLEKTLKDTYRERDKAQQELARLKQHLLDKELEESSKMDEDSQIIEELRARNEYQKVHILRLEKALKHEVAKQEEIKNLQSDEIQKLKEDHNELKQNLANCKSMVDSKNAELLNLQTALGQYYAESEAKERLEGELAGAREGSARLSELLKATRLDLEISNKEKEEVFSRLSHTERMLSETKRAVQKLQEDNSKLHRAVEQSISRINRMSMDSDFYVDRRIVIKLLVTYFQRNHSKEVLDLMVRMLGFSDEDKRRIGFAQQAAGKTGVQGVLGLPGRLVGGILGGRSPEDSSQISSENQSFADLWVDFLLKDAEQREKLESAESERTYSSAQEKGSMSLEAVPSPATTTSPAFTTSFPSVHSYTKQFSSPLEKQALSDPDAEFANVPLTSVSPKSENSSRYFRLLKKY